MLLFIIGGIMQIKYGYKLYKDGTGSQKEKAILEFWKVKIRVNSAGALLMGTAALWAWAAVSISPNLEKAGDDWKIYSLSTNNIEVTSPMFKSEVIGGTPENVIKSSDKLKELLAGAIKEARSADGKVKNISLNGKSAFINLKSLKTFETETGEFLVTAEVGSEARGARLSFRPEVKENSIVFVPYGMHLQSGNGTPEQRKIRNENHNPNNLLDQTK